MNRLRRFLLTLLTVCALIAVAQSATAKQPFAGFYGYGYPFGFGWDYNRSWYHANARVLPYFSLYPPVHYSHSVPRPYGFSPFALPPGVPPVEATQQVEETAKEIANPYFRPKKEQEGVSEDSVTTAKVIMNPYFKRSHLPDREQFVRRLNKKLVE